MNWKTVLTLVVAFLSGAAASYTFITKRVKSALRETISKLIDDAVDSVYPCKLIATIRYNQEIEQNIVDMSRYDKEGIIGITIDKTISPASEEEEALDNTSIFYKNAVVYNMGGHWFWKVL
jgi:hypothetical protein